MTADILLKIFYSNRPDHADWEYLDEISWMINEGMVEIKPLEAIKHKSFQKKLNSVTSSNSKLIKTGESSAHMALKLAASDFLKTTLNIPEKDLRYELPLIGFEVDVIDKNLFFPIECGDTSAIKLEKYLALSTTKIFFILPYPHLENLIVYQFVALPKFFEYIKFKHQHQNEKNAKFR